MYRMIEVFFKLPEDGLSFDRKLACKDCTRL